MKDSKLKKPSAKRPRRGSPEDIEQLAQRMARVFKILSGEMPPVSGPVESRPGAPAQLAR